MRRSSGFTLIEVLVALLVLAVGLLGVAALQFRGIQYSQGALMRSMVSTLTYDITERIRSNAANVDTYVVNTPYTVGVTAPAGCDPAAAPDALNDLTCWEEQLANALPPGSTADITKNGNNYIVTITWTDRDGTDHPVSYTFMSSE